MGLCPDKPIIWNYCYNWKYSLTYWTSQLRNAAYCIVCFSSGSWGWQELVVQILSSTTRDVIIFINPGGKNQNFMLKIQALLSIYHFCIKIKLKTGKSRIIYKTLPFACDTLSKNIYPFFCSYHSCNWCYLHERFKQKKILQLMALLFALYQYKLT